MFARPIRTLEKSVENALALFSSALFIDLFFSADLLSQPLKLTQTFPVVPWWSGFYWLSGRPLFLTVLTCIAGLLVFLWWRKKPAGFHLLFAVIFIMLFHVLPLIYNPGLPFLVWLHLAFAIKHQSLDPKTDRLLKQTATGLFCLGYFLSGLDKFRSSPSWQDGLALDGILQGIYGRWQLVNTYWQMLPRPVRQGITWSVPLVELSALLPLLWNKAYKPVWWAVFSLQLANLLLLKLFVVSVPMILLQLFIGSKNEAHNGATAGVS